MQEQLTREQQVDIVDRMKRALMDAGCVGNQQNLALLLADGIWEEARNYHRDVDRISIKAGELFAISTRMINDEISVLKTEYIELNAITAGMVDELEELRQRLNRSTIGDTLLKLEERVKDAHLITPKLAKLLALVEEISSDIEDL